MKILVISNNYPPYFDGISIHTNNLVSQLIKKGHKVRQINFDKKFTIKNFTLLDLFYSKATFNTYYSPFNLVNVNYFFSPDKGLRNFVFTNLVSRVSRKHIEDFMPDIIHVTYPRLFSAIENTKLPIVLSVYSEEIRDSYPVSKVLNRSNSIISISKFTRNLIKQINPAAEVKTTVIPCSIEIESYLNKCKYEERENYIVSIGRLSKEKNFDTTIKAFSLLPDQIRNKYKYFIIGGGSEEKSLQMLIDKLNLQDSVKLLGNLSEDKKIEYLIKSKVFLLCPRIKQGEQEGFGIVYLEAQAASIPIITSEVGGIKEAVGDAGIYISQPENSQSIAVMIEKLVQNQQLAKKLINIGNQRIESYDHSRWINRIIKVYENLLNTK